MKVPTITAPIESQIQQFQQKGYLRPDALINIIEKKVEPKISVPKHETANQYFSPTAMIQSVKESTNKVGEKINFVF